MRKISGLFLLLTALCAAGAWAAGPVLLVPPGSDSAPPQIRIIAESRTGLTLEFGLPALEVEDVAIDGQTFRMAAIPEGAMTGDVGQPMIPVFNRYLAIPEGAEVTVRASVLEEDEHEGLRLMPVQDEDSSTFSLDADAYSRDDFGDAPVAAAGAAASMRGLRLVPLTFSPVRFNPAEGKLRVARRMEVEVQWRGNNIGDIGEGVRSLPPSFDRLYRRLVLNYDAVPQRAPLESGTWLVITPNDAALLASLQPLVEWRQRMGYPVRVATTAETGTTNTLILAFIQNAYNNWAEPPEHIVLVGDANGTFSIPCWSVGGGETDQPYTRLDGNDYLSDVHLGRLSVSSVAQLDVVVAKTVGYETNPPLTDAGWFTRACLTGDPNGSGPSTIGVMQWIKTRLRQIGYTQIDTIFAAPFPNRMSAALNLGDTIFCYRGFGGMSGWQNTNTNSLTNFSELPFGVMSTCGTGSFAGSTCVSEGFLRAGTASAPIGAVGAIGTATGSTHTRYNNCYTMGVWQGVLYEDQWEMGAAHTRGKYELVMNYGEAEPNQANNFCSWNNLMGDPACPIWTAFPAALTVSHPSAIAIGTNALVVTVLEEDSTPVPGAQVCLLKGTEVHTIGATDGAGRCELALGSLTPGTMKLTVTRHNRLPFRTDIPVAMQPVFVGYEAFSVDDDDADESQGNGDGAVNPGEAIELHVSLRDFGTDPAAGVSATLSSVDPYVTVTDGQEDFGDLEAGSSAWCIEDFDFSVDLAAPHGRVLRFALEVASGENRWHSLVEVPVLSGDLNVRGITLNDPGNFMLDPGETLEMSVRLQNDGGATAADTRALLTSLSPWVSVSQPQSDYGTIGVGQTAENLSDRFVVTASPDTYRGHLAVFRLTTTFNEGAVDTAYISLPVGQRSSLDPIGPDRYGYYGFDNTDSSYDEAPVFQWIEIDPAYGGPGTAVQLGDYGDAQDKSRTVDLPFPFQYYGQSFTRATICSNGWLAMGSTYLTDYRNWTIPGAGAPQNMLAVFWDDLYERTNGHVYTWHDQLNHRWIVEWSRVVNAVGGATQIFEAILSDPAYHPTTTGDGIIVFQYSQASSNDYVDGYATVGIENADHTDGLLYTYFGRLAPGAAGISSGRAIRFVPVHIDPAETAEETGSGAAKTSLDLARPNPFSESTTLAFSMDATGRARLGVYDVQGRCVRRILDGTVQAGRHQAFWDGKDDLGHDLPAGLYLLRLECRGHQEVRKAVRLE